MTRFFNFLLFSILSLCIFETFSVKKNVGELAWEIKVLERKIASEKATIALYQLELSKLTQPARIRQLVAQLLPEMNPATADQMQSLSELNQNRLQLASHDVMQQQDYVDTSSQRMQPTSINDDNLFTVSTPASY